MNFKKYTCWSDMTLEEMICYICDYEYKYFLSKFNVVGVGLGYKITNGFYTNEECIKVFVEKKLSENKLLLKDIIPKMYKGIKTDVVSSGKINIFSLSKRIRPTEGGYSISPINSTYLGTLGCLVTNGNYNYILSNNHILADLNKLPVDRTPIIQPAEIDGGDPVKDIVAVLSKFIPIKLEKFLRQPANYVDCAIAKVINKSIASTKIDLIGEPREAIYPRLNMEVKKVGTTTELTKGKITDINVTYLATYSSKDHALFKKQILTTPMASFGDSGAILLNNNNYVVGLLFAGNEEETVYNDINYVLKGLNVRLMTK